MNLALEVSSFAQARGASLVGFADLESLPGNVRGSWPRAVVLAVALEPATVVALKEGPTRAYHAEYERVNRLLDSLSVAVADFLKQKGYKALSAVATDHGVDPGNISTQLPHKTVATRAGLGWVGKCALLVTEQYGSAVRLNRVLTDAPLPAGSPIDQSRCGACEACVQACPAHAPLGRSWSKGLNREEFFNAFACRQTARSLAFERTGIVDTFCGICIAACPWTQRGLEARRP